MEPGRAALRIGFVLSSRVLHWRRTEECVAFPVLGGMQGRLLMASAAVRRRESGVPCIWQQIMERLNA